MISLEATNLPIQKGCKVFVRGSTKSFIAQNDIISNPVLIVDGKAFSNDSSRSQLTRTTEFFQSASKTEQESGGGWVYLFEIQEPSDTSFNFVETSWEYNEWRGGFEPLGDGSGRYATAQDGFDDLPSLVDETFYSRFIARNIIVSKSYLNNNQDIATAYTIGVDHNSPGELPDQEISGNSRSWLFFDLDRTRTRRGDSYYEIESDRNYYLEEGFSYVLKANYKHDLGNGQYIGIILGVAMNQSGQLTFLNDTASVFLFPNNNVQPYGLDWNFHTSERADFNVDLRAEFNSQASISTDYSSLDGTVFTGANIIAGNAKRNITVSPGFPSTISAVFNANASAQGYPRTFVFELDSYVQQNNSFYSANLYREDIELPREPGSRSIRIQVDTNSPTELLQIPLTEPYQGLVSPVGDELEVVIKHGKQRFNFIAADAGLGALYTREWLKVRKYRLSSSGSIISTTIYNNPAAIAIDEANWQKEWLENYEDYRTYEYNLLNETINASSPRHHLFFRTGLFDSLNKAYRTYYSDRNTLIPTQITFELYWGNLDWSSYGTLVGDKFIYLIPQDLYDENLPTTQTIAQLYFPWANYSIVEGLRNQSSASKVYFETTGEYTTSFTQGISTQKATVFPVLQVDINLDSKDIGIIAIAFF